MPRPTLRSLFLILLIHTVQISFADLNIPQSHPRLWWNADSARIQKAREWYAAHKPASIDPNDPFANALDYVMTGDATKARTAINKLMSFTISNSELAGVASDNYRWNDWVPAVFDWCYDQMTPAERQTFMSRYDGYVDTIRTHSWGGPGMPFSNYFWGYFRNELSWSIATYYDDPSLPAGTVRPMAQTFQDWALITRWQNSAVPYLSKGARGGVPGEGSQYGRYQLQYVLMPFVSTALMGRDLFTETNWYKESIFYMIYATSLSPIGGKYRMFPFCDDEMSYGFPASADWYYGDYMTMMAREFSGTALEKYARQWLGMVGASANRYIGAVDAGGPTQTFNSLPLDYAAPGYQYMFMKDKWAADGMNMLWQLCPAGGHTHKDSGHFALDFNGQRFITELTGYSENIAGYAGSGTSGADRTLAHNGVLFGKVGDMRGHANAYLDGPPKTTRLESQPNYAYAITDLSKAYRAHASGYPDRDDNPYCKSFVREFLFVRPMRTLLVFDRVESTDEKIPAASVIKSFLCHSPVRPVPQSNPNDFLFTIGNSAVKLIHLDPQGQSSTSRVVDEGNFTGHLTNRPYGFRIEQETTGQAQSYLINVLHARDLNGADVTAAISEDATSFTITLDHPTLGHAVIHLNKGMTSTGGSFGYSPSGTPSLTNLIDTVMSISVGDNGPVWGAGGGGAAGNPPTVAKAASANPNPVTTGTTADLSVLGADDAGEENLTYTWSTTGIPPSPVIFSANGTNASKNVTVTFSRNGTYSIRATIRDAGGLTVPSSVNVTVSGLTGGGGGGTGGEAGPINIKRVFSSARGESAVVPCNGTSVKVKNTLGVIDEISCSDGRAEWKPRNIASGVYMIGDQKVVNKK